MSQRRRFTRNASHSLSLSLSRLSILGSARVRILSFPRNSRCISVCPRHFDRLCLPLSRLFLAEIVSENRSSPNRRLGVIVVATMKIISCVSAPSSSRPGRGNPRVALNRVNYRRVYALRVIFARRDVYSSVATIECLLLFEAASTRSTLQESPGLDLNAREDFGGAAHALVCVLLE